MKHIITLIMIMSWLPSCTKFDNKFNENVLICGPEASDSSFSYVKILDGSGEVVNPALIENAIPRFKSDSGDLQTLTLTSKGCLKLSRESGEISISIPSVGGVIDQRIPTDHGFSELRLVSHPSVQAKFHCPVDGIYSHLDFPSLLSVDLKGSFETSEFSIQAVSKFDGQIYQLFKKPYGVPVLEIPSTLSTKDLAEGIYSVQVLFKDPSLGLDAVPTLLNAGEDCGLVVLHQKPSLISSSNALSHLNLGDVLPLQKPDATDQLFVCEEERTGVVERSSCAAQNRCREAVNFSQAAFYKTTKQGVFDVMAYSVDKAGNRSDLECQTIAVSSTAPTLTARWKDDRWNVRGALLDLPYVSLSARVDLQHSVLSQSDLAGRLECKVDFLIAGKTILAGNSAQCSSG
ncbi:MAG: hypothetical protein EOP04_13550, partial [Proteobacteria bacterium]